MMNVNILKNICVVFIILLATFGASVIGITAHELIHTYDAYLEDKPIKYFCSFGTHDMQNGDILKNFNFETSALGYVVSDRGFISNEELPNIVGYLVMGVLMLLIIIAINVIRRENGYKN